MVAVAILCLSAAKAEAARGPLVTSFIEQGDTFGPGAAQNFERMRAAGGTAIRTTIPWTAIAPAERPDGFDAADWRDGAYRWDDFDDDFDEKVRRLRSEKLEPILDQFRSRRGAANGRERRLTSGSARPRRPCAVLSRRGARARYLPERRRHVCDLVLVQVRM